jgi:hypothetical protein
MAAAKGRVDRTVEQQDIEQLRRRHADLHVKKIQAETKKRESENRLTELKKQARDQYGTDDLEELKKKLEAIKADNERMRAEYQDHLDRIERELDHVAAQHKEAMSEVEA